MPEGTTNSVVNLGDISKPVDTFIKKISKAVGGIYAPFQVTRMAKAEAQAAIIKAQNEIQITDLQRRAMNRFIEEEGHRQRNIEEIAAKAIPLLTEAGKPEAMENDWVTNFFDKSRIISDAQMQSLWARVLAGEANAPGTYSKRTVNFLSDLDKVDAELFSKLCSFGWVFGNVVPLVFDVKEDIYSTNGITFSSLSHLESIGLIQFENIAGFSRLKLPRKLVLHYYGRPLFLELAKDEDNRLGIGHVLLTRIGTELAPISGSKPVDGFWEYVQDKWKQLLPKNETKQGAASDDNPTMPNGDPV